MTDNPKRAMLPDREYIAKQAAFVRELIRDSDLFVVEIDEADHDAMLVAAYCLGAVGSGAGFVGLAYDDGQDEPVKVEKM